MRAALLSCTAWKIFTDPFAYSCTSVQQGRWWVLKRMRNSSRPGMGGHTCHSDCGHTVSCKCPPKWYKTEDCCLGWDGTWWDNAAASYRSACIGRYVMWSCWSLLGIGYGSCNCLKASFFSYLGFCFSCVFHILVVLWALSGICFDSFSKLLSCALFSSFMKW